MPVHPQIWKRPEWAKTEAYCLKLSKSSQFNILYRRRNTTGRANNAATERKFQPVNNRLRDKIFAWGSLIGAAAFAAFCIYFIWLILFE